MSISKNSVVIMHYTLKDDDGNTIDSSQGAEPLAYIHGQGHIIPGLENALEGKNQGDKIDVKITPEDGYGQRNDQMIQTVPKSEFNQVEEVKVGMQFQVDTPNGPLVLTCIDVKDNDVVLDGNHPLAGLNLNFNVEVTDVRDATKEELEHGHVHGPGGHQH